MAASPVQPVCGVSGRVRALEGGGEQAPDLRDGQRDHPGVGRRSLVRGDGWPGLGISAVFEQGGDHHRAGEGRWAEDRLLALVVGLAELQPWVDQWHNDVDPAYGVSLAAFCREQLTTRAAQVGRTVAELAAWRPAASARGRRPAQAWHSST